MNTESILLVIGIIILILVLWTTFRGGSGLLAGRLSDLEKSQARLESMLRDEFRISREEAGGNAAAQRQELVKTLTDIARMQQEALEKLTLSIETRLNEMMARNDANEKLNRDTITRNLKDFQEVFNKNVSEFNEMQRQKFNELVLKQDELVKATEQKLEKVRETVDERLQKTLETRLGQSFELVSKQLESVQKGLGEMQNLANDVGGLKRVLANVKTRGTLGEIQLGNILEQIMAPEQYETNVKTKKGSSDVVEFALRLPGKDDGQGYVYLPMDAKFPQESYHALLDAYDTADPASVELAAKSLENAIKKSARDIHEKYIDPPNTTDFGIMFLPIEGLYAEVVRRTNLIEQLQREFQVVIAGPTTLAAFLNSLQMGFKTLAIQKRSSEVWQILGAVKTEFQKFGGILTKARKKIDEAGNDIDELVGQRTRVIERKLRQVQELPSEEAKKLLSGNNLDEENPAPEEIL
jgi:DNA recombination protein RmuC